MKLRRHLGMFLATVLPATVLLAAGCYSLAWTTVSYSTPTTWTGTGRGTFTESTRGRAVGLAGQRMIMLEGSSPDGQGVIVLDNPLRWYFSGVPYVLRSYTQIRSAGYHQFGVLVAHRTGESGGVDLFVEHGIPSTGGWARARPSSASFWEAPVDARAWTIVEICDVAAISDWSDVGPDRVFASVRARPCLTSCSDSPRGGVVELELEGPTSAPSWRVVVDEYGLGNARMLDEDGYAFSDECMPIDVTTMYGDQVGDRLAVADPSTDQILMYDATRLRYGAIDVVHTPDSTRSPVDVAILGDREDGRDYIFVAALWRGSATPQLRHYVGTPRSLGDAPHLTESMSSDVRFIQGELAGVTTTPAFRGDLSTFGNRVIRRTYEY